MEKNSLRVSVLLFYFLLFFIIRSDSQQTVIYDFENKNEIQGIVPFDRPFVIKFINIDSPNVTRIVVKLYKLSVTNYKKLLQSSNYISKNKHRTAQIIITNQDILDNQALLIIPDTIVKDKNFIGRTAYMLNAVTLKPSSSYFIEIKTFSDRNLNEDEKNNLLQKLKNDKTIAKLFNDYAKRNITNPNSPYDESLSKLLIDIKVNAEKVVKSINPDYILKPSYDSNKQKRTLTKTYDDFKNFGNKLQEIFKEVKRNSSQDAAKKLDEETNDFIQFLNNVNWLKLNDKNIILNSFNQIESLKLHSNGIKAKIDDLDSALTNYIKERNNLFNKPLDTIIVSNVVVEGVATNTFPKAFKEQASQFISSDLGLAYIWGIDKINPYVAVQISLTPLDDSIPIPQFKGIGNFFRSRLSFMIGISVDGINKDSVRKGIIGNQALILGSGFKLWNWLKINGGGYFYYKEPLNPLINRNNTIFTASPFISLSIDVRVQSLLNGIGNSIFKQTSN